MWTLWTVASTSSRAAGCHSSLIKNLCSIVEFNILGRSQYTKRIGLKINAQSPQFPLGLLPCEMGSSWCIPYWLFCFVFFCALILCIFLNHFQNRLPTKNPCNNACFGELRMHLLYYASWCHLGIFKCVFTFYYPLSSLIMDFIRLGNHNKFFLHSTFFNIFMKIQPDTTRQRIKLIWDHFLLSNFFSHFFKESIWK